MIYDRNMKPEAIFKEQIKHEQEMHKIPARRNGYLKIWYKKRTDKEYDYKQIAMFNLYSREACFGCPHQRQKYVNFLMDLL